METMQVFLLRTGTADSSKEYEKILTLSDLNRNLTDNFRESLYAIHEKIQSYETQDSKSVISRSSKASKLSNTLTLKQAQLEAARVRLKFAEKEAAIHKEQALIEEKELIAEAARIRQKANLNAELELLS